MRTLRFLPVVFVMIAGCYPLLSGPGGTLDALAPSPVGITYEYTHSYSTEYPAAIQAAMAHCRQYNKTARPVGPPVRLNLDRSAITFECVAGQD